MKFKTEVYSLIFLVVLLLLNCIIFYGNPWKHIPFILVSFYASLNDFAIKVKLVVHPLYTPPLLPLSYHLPSFFSLSLYVCFVLPLPAQLWKMLIFCGVYQILVPNVWFHMNFLLKTWPFYGLHNFGQEFIK